MVANECAPTQEVQIKTRDEDILYVGEETVRVIHTPGRSPCATAYLWRDRLFTGKTLLATGLGPCPRDGDPAQQLHSIQQRLLIYPQEYLVYPSLLYRNRRVACVGDFAKYLNRPIIKVGRQRSRKMNAGTSTPGFFTSSMLPIMEE
ncbi:hypothetical protein [Acidithiobacillus sp. AMEEHan]|uniref:hypothetical protein n=1 Tax=Acidithiobacillus sp. AMEEHan TaxID=2994951 RepID=UPI0027E3C9CD|nr:hypothetical protein [Acidithiobacillus sp. AMEEHan]